MQIASLHATKTPAPAPASASSGRVAAARPAEAGTRGQENAASAAQLAHVEDERSEGARRTQQADRAVIAPTLIRTKMHLFPRK